MSRTPSSPRARRLAAGALAAGLLAPLTVSGAGAATTTGAQHQLIPAYFYPEPAEDLWPTMCSTARSSTVIVNPHNGPGADYDSDYARVIDDCRAAGQKLVGYVHTGYADRPLSEVKADIDRFYRFYAVQGIFLDEMSNDAADRDYYRQLHDHIKAKNAGHTVVGNPGAAASSNWQLAVTDVVVVFENTAAVYDTWVAPSWTLQAPSGEIAHLVHTTSSAQRDRTAHLSAQRNAGHVFLTDDVMANPWDTLPGYWGTDPGAWAPPGDLSSPITSPFADVATAQQFYPEMAWMADRGISTGWTLSDGTSLYKPFEAVNRDAMAAFLYRLAGSPAYTAPPVSPFKDVATTQKFYKEMAWLAEHEISTGWAHSDGTRSYRPFEAVNRDAMAAFLYRLAGSPAYTAPPVSPFKDVATTQKFYQEMAWLAEHEISTGWAHSDGTRSYRPLDHVKRDAMAAFLFRLSPLL
jgi:hypothetical protein